MNFSMKLLEEKKITHDLKNGNRKQYRYLPA